MKKSSEFVLTFSYSGWFIFKHLKNASANDELGLDAPPRRPHPLLGRLASLFENHCNKWSNFCFVNVNSYCSLTCIHWWNQRIFLFIFSQMSTSEFYFFSSSLLYFDSRPLALNAFTHVLVNVPFCTCPWGFYTFTSSLFLQLQPTGF